MSAREKCTNSSEQNRGWSRFGGVLQEKEWDTWKKRICVNTPLPIVTAQCLRLSLQKMSVFRLLLHLVGFTYLFKSHTLGTYLRALLLVLKFLLAVPSLRRLQFQICNFLACHTSTIEACSQRLGERIWKDFCLRLLDKVTFPDKNLVTLCLSILGCCCERTYGMGRLGLS